MTGKLFYSGLLQKGIHVRTHPIFCYTFVCLCPFGKHWFCIPMNKFFKKNKLFSKPVYFGFFVVPEHWGFLSQLILRINPFLMTEMSLAL